MSRHPVAPRVLPALLALLPAPACRHGTGMADDACAAEFTTVDIEGEPARTIGTWVPDDVGGGVHVELAWPVDAPEDGESWPIALQIQGTWGQGISDDGRLQVSDGVVEARVDLPGSPLTGGVDDRRGDASRAAVATTLDWLAGRREDVGGCTAPRRSGHGAGDDVYVVGDSNGGNLAVATLADTTLSLPEVRGLVTWETPVAPQFVNVEWGKDPTTYEEGTCTWAPGASLTCGIPIASFLELPTLGQPSTLCFDLDGDGACVAGTDVVVVGSEDPASGLRMLSPALTAAAEDAGLNLNGYGTLEEATTWWASRDASLLAPALVAAQPDLPVLLVASEEDHVQATPDHPHVHGWGQALQESGAAWTRLNPGVDWLPAAEGENAPNAPMSLSGDGLRLLTEDEEAPLGRALAAAVRELSERQATGIWQE